MPLLFFVYRLRVVVWHAARLTNVEDSQSTAGSLRCRASKAYFRSSWIVATQRFVVWRCFA